MNHMKGFFILAERRAMKDGSCWLVIRKTNQDNHKQRHHKRKRLEVGSPRLPCSTSEPWCVLMYQFDISSLGKNVRDLLATF